MTGTDRPLGLALVLLGVLGGGAAVYIGDTWGPRTVPLLAALVMVLAGGALMRPAPAVRPTPHTPHTPHTPGAWPVVSLMAIAVSYVLAIDRLGYLIATALAAPAVFALFGMRRPASLLAVALAVPLALHLIFFRVLGVFPPLGAWIDLLDHLPL